MSLKLELEELLRERDRILLSLDDVHWRMKRNRMCSLGVIVGTVVLNTEGKRFKVQSFHYVGKSAWLKGQVMLQNGEWSQTTTKLYEPWTKP